MRLPMGAFSSRVSRRAFSGPLLKHGRRLRPLSFPVNKTKGTEKRNEDIAVAATQDSVVHYQTAVQDSEGHFQRCKRQV